MGNKLASIRNMLLQHQAFVNPDELYFPILAYNHHFGLPGSCVDNLGNRPSILTNLAKFEIKSHFKNFRCSTRYYHHTCIIGNTHVPLLKRAPHLLAGKFMINFEPEAYTQLEEWYFQRVQYELNQGTFSSLNFNTSMYANRWCTRHHI